MPLESESVLQTSEDNTLFSKTSLDKGANKTESELGVKAKARLVDIHILKSGHNGDVFTGAFAHFLVVGLKVVAILCVGQNSTIFLLF